MLKKIYLALIASFISFNPAFAQENILENWKFNGEVLLRSELDGRDFNNTTPLNFYTIMRTRFSMEKSLLEGTDFYLQIEDSRIFGEEGASVANLRNIDMFQGYLNFLKPFQVPFDIQIGRFIMDYGTTRFFSSLPGWNYIGRSFDGIRIKNKNDYFNLDIFSLITNTSSRYISNASPDLYSVINQNINNTVTGIWLNKDIGFNELNLFSYYEDNRKQTKANFNDLSRITTGISHKGKYTDDLYTVEEFAFQKGNISDKETTAYLISLQAYYKFLNDFNLGMGMDILSGGQGDKYNNTMDVLYGNAHAFHGYMDYFTNIPKNTSNSGLNNFYIKLKWAKEDFPLSVNLDLHQFNSNILKDNMFSFGKEIDLLLEYRYSKNATIQANFSTFLPEDLFRSGEFFNRSDIGFWSYISTRYSF